MKALGLNCFKDSELFLCPVLTRNSKKHLSLILNYYLVLSFDPKCVFMFSHKVFTARTNICKNQTSQLNLLNNHFIVGHLYHHFIPLFIVNSLMFTEPELKYCIRGITYVCR